ncbi:MAG: hypothetical protein K2Q18_07480 [Bdellovibrionales bacterium]|nr:hypothetical protein [Bdellovibrionales bacterium]
MNHFENLIYEEIKSSLLSKIQKPVEQIYALSFFIYDMDDNPLIPTLKVGYNTEDQVKANLKHSSSADEARWNYAFWLQNEITAIGPYDSRKNMALYEAYSEWLRDLKIHFTADQLDDLQDEAEENEDEEELDRLEDAMTLVSTQFLSLCGRISLRLHEDGVIKKALGREVPILLHELEYYDRIAEQTKKANPARLANDFYNWVMGKY